MASDARPIRRSRHKPVTVAALCALVYLLSIPECSKAATNGETVVVGSGPGQVSLLKAFQDQRASTILIDGEYDIGEEFTSFVGNPLKFERNVTISGEPGKPEPVLDLGFANSVIELCSTCVLTLRNITVKNERRGTGPYFDIFVGQPGSRVTPFHVHRWHIACTSSKESAETITGFKRSPLMPRPNEPQRLSIENVTFQGKDYPDSLRYDDVTFDVPWQHQEGRGWGGGYALACTGGIRICEAYVSQDCLVDNSPDYCVNELTDKLNRKQQGEEHPGSSSPSAVMAAAIAVPIVVVAILAAVVGLLLVKRRQRRQANAAKPAASSRHPGDGGQHTSIMESPRTHGRRESMDMVRNPMGLGKGWQLSSSLTSPLVGEVVDPSIEFGELLGSGSFGRVFAARWAGREVAVKVIEHSTDTVVAVENEMQLMLSFNHDNIVRAFYCATYTRTSAPTGSEYSSNSMLHLSIPRDSYSLRTHSNTSHFPQSLNAVHIPAAAGAVLGVGRGASFDSSGRVTRDGSARMTPTGLPLAAAAIQGSHQTPSTPQQLQSQQQQQHLNRQDLSHPSTGGSTNNTGGEYGNQLSGRSSKGSAGKSAESSKRAETYLVEEYCDCGTLTGYLSQFQGALPANEEVLLKLLLLLKDTANGVACLHSNHVVHGDLNGRNVLVASDTKAKLGVTAKVSDLGLSRVIKHHETHRTTNTVGTMSHMPPELLRYGRMSPAVDIYAFGVMMWELYTGQPAFRKLQYGQFFETVVLRNLRPMIPQGMPADYQLLMEHCWATDPECRPSVDRLLECLRFMISERRGRQDSEPIHLAHSKSAPSPIALLKPLPEKKKLGQAAGSGGDSDTGTEGGGLSSSKIHSSFSGLIVGSDFGAAGQEAEAEGDASPEPDAGSKGSGGGGVVLDPQQLQQAAQRRAQHQQRRFSNLSSTPGGYLGSPVGPYASTPAGGLPPRPVVRPPATASSNQPWIQEQEQAWCI